MDPTQDDWEIGPSKGLYGDPSTAFSGTQMAGTDLGLTGTNGLYEDNATSTLTSPTLDCSQCDKTRLQFRRWANLAEGDQVRISINGELIWENLGTVADDQWIFQDLVISDQVDGVEQVQITFEFKSNNSGRAGGWNMDDVQVITNADVADVSTPESTGGSKNTDGGSGCMCSLLGQGQTSNSSNTGTILWSLLAMGIFATMRNRKRIIQ